MAITRALASMFAPFFDALGVLYDNLVKSQIPEDSALMKYRNMMEDGYVALRYLDSPELNDRVPSSVKGTLTAQLGTLGVLMRDLPSAMVESALRKAHDEAVKAAEALSAHKADPDDDEKRDQLELMANNYVSRFFLPLDFYTGDGLPVVAAPRGQLKYLPAEASALLESCLEAATTIIQDEDIDGELRVQLSFWTVLATTIFEIVPPWIAKQAIAMAVAGFEHMKREATKHGAQAAEEVKDEN